MHSFLFVALQRNYSETAYLSAIYICCIEISVLFIADFLSVARFQNVESSVLKARINAFAKSPSAGATPNSPGRAIPDPKMTRFSRCF